MEKELRSRAEEKELEEKNERVAVSAQMMAMSTEHTTKINQMDHEMSALRAEHEHAAADVSRKLEGALHEAKEANERLRGVESERDSLNEALSSQKSATDKESAALVSSLRGEVELLRERLKNSEMRTAAFGEKSADDVKLLEEQLTKMKLERRK